MKKGEPKKTTIRMEPELAKRLKVASAVEGRSMEQIVGEALERYFEAKKTPKIA